MYKKQRFSLYLHSNFKLKIMHIGFDAKKAASNLTGIGNYSRNHINLLEREKDLECTLFIPGRGKAECLGAITGLEDMKIVRPSGKSSINRTYWRNFSMVDDIKKSGVDIFHGLSNELPFGIKKAGCLSVVTIHDLIFLRYPNTYDFMQRKILTLKTRYACHNSDAIIAVSEQTKRDIVEFYGIPEEKITVIYQGCHNVFKQVVSLSERESIRQRYGLPERYMISVGTIEHRKNHHNIIEAFAKVSGDIALVLVSKHTRMQKEIETLADSLGIRKKVKILNNVPLSYLPALYQGSIGAIYASYFEGFGIPVLEAVTSGIPVIAATGSCLEEAGGKGALYVDPFNPDAIAEAIGKISNDSELCRELVSGGKEHLKNFTDEVLSSKIYDYYKMLLG